MQAARIIPLFALAGSPALAAEGAGFAEVRLHGFAGVQGKEWQAVERLRPQLTAEPADRLRLTLAVEMALTQGRSLDKAARRTLRQSDLGPFLEAAGCTWETKKNRALAIGAASDYLSVERLFADWYLPQADLRLGRQAVQWGSALMVNPTDPFPEVLLLDPWRQRRGVNALRATVPIGEDHEVQVLVGSNDTFDALRLAARGTLNIGLADLSLVGAFRQETDSGLVGVDVRGTAVVGYWLEGAIVLQKGERGSEEIAVGIDYSFPVLEGLILQAQYYRHGAGKPHARGERMREALELPTCRAPIPATVETEPDPFAPLFSGRDYGMLLIQQGVMPELSVSAVWVQNLNDGSGLAVPMITVLPTGWLEVALAAQLPFSLWGSGGELRPTREDLLLAESTPVGPIEVDLSGLVPTATFILWTRASF